MADTIKEFLVSLGYKVDTASQEKFAGSVASATKLVAKFAAALSPIALAKFTEQYADYGEKIYWIGQRANASATGILNLGFAASKLGSSTGAAQGSISALGKFLQSSPGAKSWLERWTGPFKDTNDAILKFGRSMRGKPEWLRNQLAGMIGLDYDFAQSLFSGKFEGEVDRHNAMLRSAGLDPEKFEEQSKEFMNKWDDFWELLRIHAMKVSGDLMPGIEQGFKSVTEWIEANGPSIIAWVNKAETSFEELAEKIEKECSGAFLDMITAFKELGSAGGELTEKYFPRVEGSFGGIKDIIETIAKSLRILTELLRGEFSAALTQVSALMDGQFKVKEGSIADRVLKWFSPSGISGGSGSDKEAGGIGADDLREGDANAAIGFFVGKGWSREQAAGIVASLKEESRLSANPGGYNDGGKAYGVAQWHTDRQKDFARVFGHDIRQSTYGEQLAFVDWELRNSERSAGNMLAGAGSARAAGDIVSRYYERPRAVEEAAYHRSVLADRLMSGFGSSPYAIASAGGGGGVSQVNNITVNGASDPQSTASAIGREMDRHYATLSRNLGTVFR